MSASNIQQKVAKDPQVDEMIEVLKQSSEKLVLDSIPKKIIELNSLLTSAEWNFDHSVKSLDKLNFPKIFQEMKQRGILDDLNPLMRKRKLNSNGQGEHSSEGAGDANHTFVEIPSNGKIQKHIEKIKPYVRNLVDDADALKMWISLMIPKIEDGNNFGVSIQEDTLAEIQAVESESNSYNDQFARYYTSRAKLITKALKYPGLEDYRKCVEELDEKMLMGLGLILREIRNRYSEIYDIVVKNLEKLKTPRNANNHSMF